MFQMGCLGHDGLAQNFLTSLLIKYVGLISHLNLEPCTRIIMSMRLP